MYISKVSLVNYRNFKNSFFLFDKGINTIIGENGSGKTNLFRAIRLILDDELLKFAYKIDEGDFNRSLGSWRGHWIIISLEFTDLSADEAIQSLFIHGLGNGDGEVVEKATYNLFFRPKAEIRIKLSELEEGDTSGLNEILENISTSDYETFFTGKSTADFNDPEIYKELVGDFDNVKFNFHLDTTLFGTKIPHQLSISHDIGFTFIKALRDVVSDFNNNRTNPLMNLLKSKSEEIDPVEYKPISDAVKSLNSSIEGLSDVQEIRANIKETIKEAVGETYSPSSLSIKSSLPDEADKLLQSLKLFIGEPDEDYEGGIHELSLGGANLIFLTLKLLEFKYQKAKESFANFLLIEEPEAHIHTHIQKTLFDKLDYGDTQIIYSTHSTFISESSNISKINILSKGRNLAEVFQPTIGLDPKKTIKLQRYLDAVRSNLLFAKGVILVEGDAEQILIPLLVKKVLGITLDELGISLINIGSTGFENVAQLFHDDRVRRRCSVVTDSDTAICDVTINPGDDTSVIKYKTGVFKSQKSGLERKAILDEFVDGNAWLKVCYSNYTFEIDFLQAGNQLEILETVSEVYSSSSTQILAAQELVSSDIAISGRRLLRMAKNHGKGWYAILLGEFISFKTVIPEYILWAIIFSKASLSRDIIVSILTYRIKEYKNTGETTNFALFELEMEKYRTGNIDLPALVISVAEVKPDDQIISFLEKL
jgi:putative ATP-dependent endonuclease of OLD family